VGGEKQERGFGSQRFDLDFEQAPLFSVVKTWEPMILGSHDREPRQHGVSVSAALEIDVVSERDLHAGEFAQHCWLIDSVGALSAAVDFLKGNNVGIHGLDNTGRAREIDFAIDPCTVLDVVA
jgi:hypothetical protein